MRFSLLLGAALVALSGCSDFDVRGQQITRLAFGLPATPAVHYLPPSQPEPPRQPTWDEAMTRDATEAFRETHGAEAYTFYASKAIECRADLPNVGSILSQIAFWRNRGLTWGQAVDNSTRYARVDWFVEDVIARVPPGANLNSQIEVSKIERQFLQACLITEAE